MSPRKLPERPKVDRHYDIRDIREAFGFIRIMAQQIAHDASETMQDHLGDNQVVRRMHDTIGSVAAIQDTCQLHLPPADPKGRYRRIWARLDNPLAGVKRVRVMRDGTEFTATSATGDYWTGPGWEGGVSWSVLLGWGPLEEVR